MMSQAVVGLQKITTLTSRAIALATRWHYLLNYLRVAYHETCLVAQHGHHLAYSNQVRQFPIICIFIFKYRLLSITNPSFHHELCYDCLIIFSVFLLQTDAEFTTKDICVSNDETSIQGLFASTVAGAGKMVNFTIPSLQSSKYE